MDYKTLDDDELISLLFTEEDRLPREAVDEFVRRGEDMVEALDEIVSTKYPWLSDGSQWWAVVHAAFILGAIGTKETVLPLLKSLRYSSAYDCDWVITELPSIFGKLGPVAVEGLKMIAGDRSSDWYERAHALDGLAAITLSYPETEEELFKFIYSIFSDETQDGDIRDSAGNVLMDFKREEYKEALMAYGQEADDLSEADPATRPYFNKADVLRAFASGEKDLWHYTRNWLEFYDKEKIKDRQERWKEEDRKALQRDQKEHGELPHSGSPYVLQTPKTGRNDPCPCGSGKKFKKCCGVSH